MLCQLTVISPPLVEHPDEVSVEPQTWPLLSRAWQTSSGDCGEIVRSAHMLRFFELENREGTRDSDVRNLGSEIGRRPGQSQRPRPTGGGW